MKRKRSTDARTKSKSRRVLSGAAVMQPAVTNALTKALFIEWAHSGYGALSLEAVAKRARVGKAALYRRWSSKLAMVSDRLLYIGVAIIDLPDTGSLESDIHALLHSLQRTLCRPLIRRILPDLFAEMQRNPEIASVGEKLQASRRQRGVEILLNAIARKELHPETDIELGVDLLVAPLYWRLTVTRGEAKKAYIDRLSRTLLVALHSLH